MRRLILFAKRPILNKVKTRLVPELSAEQALELYRAFLSDQTRFLRSFASELETEVRLDGPSLPDAGLSRLLAGLRVRDQGEGDLGQRLLRAFQHAWREGTSATVVIGADAPTLPRDRVLEAFDRLAAGVAAVIGPAEDGGYVLIGLRRPLAELFRDVPWGGSAVSRVTRERAVAGGLELLELDPWYDVDDRHGLTRLREDLADPATALRAPATARSVRELTES